jgi:hypothetical protein
MSKEKILNTQLLPGEENSQNILAFCGLTKGMASVLHDLEY